MSVRVHTNHNGLQEVIEHDRGRYVERSTDGDLVVLDDEAKQVALYPPNGFIRVDLDEPGEPDAKWTGDADECGTPEHLFGVAGRGGAGESLAQQVARLAEFITENIDGEPSRSQGAIDTAIRIMTEGLGSDVDPTAPGRVVRVSNRRWQIVRRQLIDVSDPNVLQVDLVPYDESRSTVGPVPAEVHADPTDDEVAQARAQLEVISITEGTSTQAGDSPVDGRPTDGYLADAETWTPEQPVPPVVLALMRIDRVIGNEYALTPTGLGRVRRLVLDALNAWPRDDRAYLTGLQERVHELEEELPQVREALMRALTDRGELRARLDSMKGKRDRAREHAVRNERERDDALGALERNTRAGIELAQQRDEARAQRDTLLAERDALLEEREHWIDRQVVETLRTERDEARALAGRLRADFETRARDGRTQVEALVADNQRLREALDAQNHATDDLRGDLAEARARADHLSTPRDIPTVMIGDRLSVEDGEGKGVSGSVQAWTTAPGGIPFVILVGDDGH